MVFYVGPNLVFTVKVHDAVVDMQFGGEADYVVDMQFDRLELDMSMEGV